MGPELLGYADKRPGKGGLQGLAVFHEVEVDIAAGRVTVTADENLRNAITAALQASGYPERKSG